jgi:CheY-like chemotaxis protein
VAGGVGSSRLSFAANHGTLNATSLLMEKNTVKARNLWNPEPTVILPLRVLYAEDDPQIAALVKLTLEMHGWRVTLARENSHFDLILMDLQMPGMNGLEATRAIREKETGTRIPIVAVTASGLGRREECLAAGMDGILPKPFRVSGLVAAIKCCLVSEY